jgi:hypothetical protein
MVGVLGVHGAPVELADAKGPAIAATAMTVIVVRPATVANWTFFMFSPVVVEERPWYAAGA